MAPIVRPVLPLPIDPESYPSAPPCNTPWLLQWLLRCAVPFQSVVDQLSPTHRFINEQALEILQRDGRRLEASLFERYLQPFNDGCDWADTDWKNVGHMYDPTTGTGFPWWPDARQIARNYWDRATNAVRNRSLTTAFYYLGASAHLVQDMCVPHHSAAKLFAGHKLFESYAREHRQQFAVGRRGLYGLAATPEEWVTVNATYTRDNYSNCLTARPDRAILHRAITDLLPRAQRSTAGFVSNWLVKMGMV